MLRIVTRKAPAKINLYLELLAKRPDGYHELVTVMHAIDLHDTVRVEQASAGIAVATDNPSLPTDERNLAHRAAALFFDRTGRTTGVRIRLEKRIPTGAGLGGGSSDAAAVLKALNELFDAGIGNATLGDWAADIGSDVPFFIRCGTARCEGRGELVTQAQGPTTPIHFLLYIPNNPVSSADVYSHVSAEDLTPSAHSSEVVEKFTADRDVTGLRGALFNRLEQICMRLHPELLAVKSSLGAAIGADGPVRMSGSGSSFFSVHESSEEAQAAAARTAASSVPVELIATQSLTDREK